MLCLDRKHGLEIESYEGETAVILGGDFKSETPGGLLKILRVLILWPNELCQPTPETGLVTAAGTRAAVPDGPAAGV